jgi:hypothetical protein
VMKSPGAVDGGLRALEGARDEPCIHVRSCAPPGRIGLYRLPRWFHHRLMSAVPPGQTLPLCRRSSTSTRSHRRPAKKGQTRGTGLIRPAPQKPGDSLRRTGAPALSHLGRTLLKIVSNSALTSGPTFCRPQASTAPIRLRQLRTAVLRSWS